MAGDKMTPSGWTDIEPEPAQEIDDVPEHNIYTDSADMIVQDYWK